MGKYIFIALLLHGIVALALFQPFWVDVSLYWKDFSKNIISTTRSLKNSDDMNRTPPPIQKENKKNLKKKKLKKKVVQQKPTPKKLTKNKQPSIKKKAVQSQLKKSMHPSRLPIHEQKEHALSVSSSVEKKLPNEQEKTNISAARNGELYKEKQFFDRSSENALALPSSDIHPSVSESIPEELDLSSEDIVQIKSNDEEELILLTPEEKSLYPSEGDSSDEIIARDINGIYQKKENGSGRN